MRCYKTIGGYFAREADKAKKTSSFPRSLTMAEKNKKEKEKKKRLLDRLRRRGPHRRQTIFCEAP